MLTIDLIPLHIICMLMIDLIPLHIICMLMIDLIPLHLICSKVRTDTKLHEELGWESLSDSRWCRRILQIHKIKNNMTPSYLKINYHLTADFCIDVKILILFMK